jgi:hypothetical protein
MSKADDIIEANEVAIRGEQLDESAMAMVTPWGVAAALGLKLYDWQINVMRDVVPMWSRVALAAANGSGKTANVVAPLAIWHALVFKNSKTVITSGAWRQVKQQLFPNIRGFGGLLDGWEFNDHDFKTPAGSVCYGFATDDPKKFEGHHAIDHTESPLFIIIDEAKGVADDIFEAKSRCQPTRELVVSSPGASFGKFYDAFHKTRHLYKTHTVTAFDCPHISRNWINEQIAEYGETHPLIRSMIYGEFMSLDNEGYVIPSGVLQRCLQHPIMPDTGMEVHAFCDFAAGGDENVLALRRGNVVEIVRAWKETNTMSACGEFIMMFNKLGLRPEYISADAGGMGKVWCDRFAELGWNVNRIDFGSKANNTQFYSNKAAEIWGEGAKKIEDKKIILPKDDETLKQQLITRKWDGYFSDGKMKLVSKEKMRNEGLKSPDRAEAVLGAMMPANSFAPINQVKGFITQFRENAYNNQIDSFLESSGCNVGDY